MAVELQYKSPALQQPTRGIITTDIMRTGTMVTMAAKLDIVVAVVVMTGGTINRIITCRACREHIIQVMVSAICVVSVSMQILLTGACNGITGSPWGACDPHVV